MTTLAGKCREMLALGATAEMIVLLVEAACEASADSRPLPDDRAERRRAADRDYQAAKRRAVGGVSSDNRQSVADSSADPSSDSIAVLAKLESESEKLAAEGESEREGAEVNATAVEIGRKIADLGVSVGNSLKSWLVINSWLEEGFELGADILPTVRAIVERLRQRDKPMPKSLRYFTAAIRQAHAERLAGGLEHAQDGQNGAVVHVDGSGHVNGHANSVHPPLIFVAGDTPQWEAWTKHRGRAPPRDKNNGWRFASEWPPN